MSRNRFCAFIAGPLLIALIAASHPVAHAQTFSILYNFGTNSGDPAAPQSPGIVAQGRDGNFYSTAEYGAEGCGAIFEITPAGTLTDLHDFDRTDGCDSYSGLTLGTDGNFYGTASAGGAFANGDIFQVAPGGGFTAIHMFGKRGPGAGPRTAPVQGLDGNFYGTTFGTDGDFGNIYKLHPSGAMKSLHQCNGCNLLSPLVQGADNNFYGTTESLGKNHVGTIFKITPGGKLRVIYDLNRKTGYNIVGPLVQGSDGKFYGAASAGGTNGVHGFNGPGTIFRITRSGKLEVLYNFNGTSDAGSPIGGLVQGNDGNFYGTAAGDARTSFGIIYRITPAGSFSVLHTFNNTAGAYPLNTMVQHTNGIFYGDTIYGGLLSQCHELGCGVFYSVDLGLPPFVKLLPSAASVGATVEILGQGLTGTTAVSFNGVAASFTVESDTYLAATVPSGFTTGFVTVTTPGGTLTSNTKLRRLP